MVQARGQWCCKSNQSSSVASRLELTSLRNGQIKERKGSNFTTEIRAGLVTFFAMAYILAVNSSIVADTGGTCVCNGGADDPICTTNEEYLLCSAEIKRDLVTATAAISALSTFFMGLLANL